jgi:Protein of unknown function (DUF2489)
VIEFTSDQKTVMVTTARMIIAGKIDLIEGCHIIAKQIYGQSSKRDDVLITFIGVKSETDHLPLADARKHWAPEALSLKDKERDDYARRIRDDVIKACNEIIKRYG